VQLEKAFAIKASPDVIFQALKRDLAAGEPGRFQVERSVPNELLEVTVKLQGGVDALIEYRLIPRDDHTEVVATMAPQGLRYKVFQIITFGRVDTNYELVLVQGLSNLKQEVEGMSSS
jgi:hypothetical protein